MQTDLHIRNTRWRRPSGREDFWIGPLRNHPMLGQRMHLLPRKGRMSISLYVRLSPRLKSFVSFLWIQIHEFEIPRAQAERILSESGGDLKKALVSLVASKWAVTSVQKHVSSKSWKLVMKISFWMVYLGSRNSTSGFDWLRVTIWT